jgi:hypothetical protein
MSADQAYCTVAFVAAVGAGLDTDNIHSRTVHFDIIKVFFAN